MIGAVASLGPAIGIVTAVMGCGMVVVAAAIAGAAVIGAGVSLYSSGQQASAAEEAANTQAGAARSASQDQLQAQRESIAFQREGLMQSRADLEPWRTAGGTAIGQLGAGTQPGGQFAGDVPLTAPGVPAYTPLDPRNFQEDPSYQFRVREGVKALDRSASAKGNLVSGSASKGLLNYGQEAGAQEFAAAYGRNVSDYQQQLAGYDRNYRTAVEQFNAGNINRTNQFNRLSSVAGTGQAAAQQLATSGVQVGQNIGNQTVQTGANIAQNTMGAANAQAAGIVGAANARASGYGSIGGAANSFAQYRRLSSLPRQGQGGGGVDTDPYYESAPSADFTY